MDERGRAIRILRQTRDALARRLTERILEAEEEILAEAEGESFLSEIETIYDQIGIRLAHVNQMLSHLPAAAETEAPQKPPHWTSVGMQSCASRDASVPTSDAANTQRAATSFLALPAPGDTRAGNAAIANLAMFGFHLRRGNIDAAAISLESAFGLNRMRAIACIHVFHMHCQHDPAYFENAVRLHNYLHADALSQAFGVLCDGLGLTGSEALAALMWWRTRLPR